MTTPIDDAGTAGNCTVQTSTVRGTDSSCSLRDALAEATNLGSANIWFDTTVFTASNTTAENTITASNGTFGIPPSTAINGPQAEVGGTLTNLVTVNGNGNLVFYFSPDQLTQTASIANLTITGGSSPNNGGGIFNLGTLTITGCTISGNSSMDTPYSAPSGGGIFNQGTMTVAFSTIANNSAFDSGEQNGGGGTAWGGGIFNMGTLKVTNSTIANNSAEAYSWDGDPFAEPSGGGGGIGNLFGSVTVMDSTISGNTAGGGWCSPGGEPYQPQPICWYSPYGTGGGIGGGNVTLTNSIVSGNYVWCGIAAPDLAIPTCPDEVDGGYTNNGGNLVGEPTPGTLPVSALGNHGGPTQTMIPLPGPGTICMGLASNIPSGDTTDQRGYPRVNTAYPGFTEESPCLDSGAVQSKYTAKFTGEPPDAADPGMPMTPPPVVALYENGVLAKYANSSALESDPDGLLPSKLSAPIASGKGALNNLVFSGTTSSDELIVSAVLNGTVTTATTHSIPFAIEPSSPPASVTSPTPGSGITGSIATFTWTPGASGAKEFEFKLGTTGKGSTNLYDGPLTTATSSPVIGIPTNGATLYAQLFYELNGTWHSIEYTYTESGTPTLPFMTSPGPGSTLTGSTATFTWNPGAGATLFELEVGTHLGWSDVYHAGPITGASVTVNNIPTNGKPLYVTLYYRLNSGWKYILYRYTEQ